MPVTLRSYAKVNLGLAIGPARPDGFHALTTLYQTIEAHDLLTVEVSRVSRQVPDSAGSPGIRLTSNDPRVPLDARNTVWKILAQALALPGREAIQAHEGMQVAVHIDKRLPIQGGLGGGSANAAAALLGLERELARQQLAPPMTGEQRLLLAAQVGSDVPLFLLGGAVLGTGRGESVIPLADLPRLPAVVALPNTGVSTPLAFRAWDAGHAAASLTPGVMTGRLSRLSRALASAYCEEHATGVLLPTFRDQGLAGTLLSSLVQTGILLNDFEEVVFRQHPFLEQIKRVLAGEPAGSHAAYAALSGSGSALFGLYSEEEAADEAQARLNMLGIRSLRTHTVDRACYWAGMVIRED
jgi:4-diphosphocytidyl-2-C-methyl-D-erythritol kinase